MKVLLAHNFYRRPGGEDRVFALEKALLNNHGVNVTEFVDTNERVNTIGKLSVAASCIWSRSSRKKLKTTLRANDFDIAHFHNTFLMISPSAYYACREAYVPVVQTLHNYRLLCPAATFYRDGRVCEDCLRKRFPVPGFIHACYHNSHAHSAAIMSMLGIHHLIGTWKRQVDAYIAPSAFVRRKFVEGGFPEERIYVKPNFVDPDPGFGSERGNFALFVGRLTQEKGVLTLIEAWKGLREVPLKIVGDGPLADKVQQLIQSHGLGETVEPLGWVERNNILLMMKMAAFLVFPSTWYEALPLTIVECFACGLPVIAARHGTMEQVVRHGFTGLHVEPGSADDLAQKVQWASGHPDEMKRMSAEARKEYETRYTADQNYKILSDIYSRAIETQRKERGSRLPS